MGLTGALVALALFVPAAGQSQTVRFGVVADSVRAMLASAWSEDPAQVERAYCVRRARISARRISDSATDSIIRVLAVVPAVVRRAGVNSADFECAPGTPEIHTHAPATCVSDDPHWCVPEGPEAYSCQPSRGDYEKLIGRGDAYAVLQCDRHAFRFYYPSEFVIAGSAPPGPPLRSPY